MKRSIHIVPPSQLLINAVTVQVESSQNHFCGVEVWRGGLGGAYRLPTLSSVGASLALPCFRFHTPLIEPDVRICRIRLSEKTHAIAEANDWTECRNKKVSAPSRQRNMSLDISFYTTSPITVFIRN